VTSFRPGKNLVRVTFVLALFSTTAFFWWPSLILLIVAMVVVAIGALKERGQLKQTLANISVSRDLPAVIGRNSEFVARLTVFNKNSFRVHGELRDELPPPALPPMAMHNFAIAAGHTSVMESLFRIPRRGQYTFGPVWIRVKGFLALLEAQRPFDCVGEIKILPETFASRERMQKGVGAEVRLLDQIQRSRQQGSGTEFESLQPYRLGDDPRRIDWRATARQRSLVVRHFQVERHRDVMIIVDSGRLMGSDAGRGSKLDCAVDSALNLARVVLQSGDRCGVAAYDRKVVGFLPPLAGASALRSLAECVYDLQSQWHESDFTTMLAELRSRQAKRAFLIVLSDLADVETSQRTCASLIQLQRQHLVLFAALRTPVLGQIVHQPIADISDTSRKAVVFRLMRDRRLALHALRRNGVHVVDVEPSQLTLPLVNQFIELRQRNML
jgi:uncharacterized protein (DUF58 family)